MSTEPPWVKVVVTTATVLLVVGGVATMMYSWTLGFTEQPEAPYVLGAGVALVTIGALLTRHSASGVKFRNPR